MRRRPRAMRSGPASLKPPSTARPRLERPPTPAGARMVTKVTSVASPPSHCNSARQKDDRRSDALQRAEDRGAGGGEARHRLEQRADIAEMPVQRERQRRDQRQHHPQRRCQHEAGRAIEGRAAPLQREEDGTRQEAGQAGDHQEIRRGAIMGDHGDRRRDEHRQSEAAEGARQEVENTDHRRAGPCARPRRTRG